MLRAVPLMLCLSSLSFAEDLVPVIGPLDFLSRVSGEPQFALRVPKGSQARGTTQAMKDGRVVMGSWSGQLGETGFSAMHNDYPPSAVAKYSAEQFLRDTLASMCSQMKATVASQKPISLGEAKGVEVELTGPAGPLKARLYYVNGRVIVLAVLGPLIPEAQSFLESLKMEGPQRTTGVDVAEQPKAAPAGPVEDTPSEGGAKAGVVQLRDPANDDFGPGTYKYPTDSVYQPGSFDLLGLRVSSTNGVVSFDLQVGATLQDPWKLGTGFALQHAAVFIDLDGNAKNGNREGIPGLNVSFAEGHGWDRAVLITPQSAARVEKELKTKAASLAASVIVPPTAKGAGRFIHVEVPRSKLGPGDPRTWRYQVTLGGQEGFPSSTSVLVRIVNEYEGAHRFGGGTDSDCDPHVLDVLGGAASGSKEEAEAQKKQLAYECNDDGSTKKPATLELVKLR